jgi:hypothetical protein
MKLITITDLLCYIILTMFPLPTSFYDLSRPLHILPHFNYICSWVYWSNSTIGRQNIIILEIKKIYIMLIFFLIVSYICNAHAVQSLSLTTITCTITGFFLLTAIKWLPFAFGFTLPEVLLPSDWFPIVLSDGSAILYTPEKRRAFYLQKT